VQKNRAGEDIERFIMKSIGEYKIVFLHRKIVEGNGLFGSDGGEAIVRRIRDFEEMGVVVVDSEELDGKI
jgi:hypothetical protein